MSPKSGGRAQRRLRRNLWISVLVVVGDLASVPLQPSFGANWSPRLGLDLAGGVSVVYTAEGHNVSQADLDETVNILNLRVNGLGVSGAEVQTSGKNQISVSIPGVTDAQQVLNQIGQTARMYFRPVLCSRYPRPCPRTTKGKVPAPGVETIPACASSPELTAANLDVNTAHRDGHEQRAPGSAVRGATPDQRREARLPQRAPCSCPGLPAPADSRGLRCVLGPGRR